MLEHVDAISHIRKGTAHDEATECAVSCLAGIMGRESAYTGKTVAICAGFGGFILAENPETKAEFDRTMREIIAAARELGSTGVIMVPAFNGQKPCLPHTARTREYLCVQMHELGEYALKHNTTVILEPLNRAEAHYLRQVADAGAICRDSASAGVKCMGDYWHMKEETSDYAAFISAGQDYLQHVHISSRGNRVMPGEDGQYGKGKRLEEQIKESRPKRVPPSM